MIILTPKREKLAVLVAGGMTQTEAYRQSFNANNMKDKTIWESASKIMADPKVKARIMELKEESANRIMWAREDSIRILAEIASNNDEVQPKDKIAAVKELNAMEGHNKPTKQEHTFVGLAELLSSIPK